VVEVVEATTEFSFEVPASRSNDTEPNRPVVFEEQVVAFAVVHYHRVRLVNVRIGRTILSRHLCCRDTFRFHRVLCQR